MNFKFQLQANVTEIDVMIPAKFHNTLIGAGGKMVQSISEDCGGVQIKFPDAKSKSDRVILIGPSDDVVKAREILLGRIWEYFINLTRFPALRCNRH